MNVANLELCKELYELSGWGELATKDQVSAYAENGHIPAYDLGYLLRKLPREINEDDDIKWLSIEPQAASKGEWSARYSDENYKNPEHLSYADTPEDAACKIAIELFKQGVLTKEQKKG